MKRLFIGIPLTPEAKRGVEKVMKLLSKKHWPVKWEPDEKWHLTLIFLDKVREGGSVSEVVRGISTTHTAFTLGFNGLGQFPKASRKQLRERVSGRMAKPVKVLPTVDIALPKVIWLGIKGEVYALGKLQKTLRYELQNAGFEMETRAFHPHVTLGRVLPQAAYAPKVEMAKELAKLSVLDIPQEWRVDQVNIFESELAPQGSVYHVVETIKLVE